jgi:predicted peptidase
MGRFETRSVVTARSERSYKIYLPDNLATPSPAILFLHGRGESGSDIEAPTRVGLGEALRTRPDAWPFIVIFPQKLDECVFWPSYDFLINDVLRDVEKEFAIDPNRRYLTGISQGGNGCFTLAKRLAWRFAAVAPVCGWGDPTQALVDLADTPVWAFHGTKDEAIDYESSVAIINRLKRYGGNARLTLYDGVDHSSWIQAYQEPLGEWFLSHSLDR